MDIKEITSRLEQQADFFEVYEVIREFEAYRHTKSGEDQKVTVRILDAGPDEGMNRYTVDAESEDGKRATGNAYDTIDMALSGVHWQDLD